MENKFINDSVIKFTPVSFAATFITQMRKKRNLANVPSLRTAISIPKFLTARYFRKNILDPMDYLEAAVYNTPYEDQEVARKIAYDILFPKSKKKKEKKKDKSNNVHTEIELTGIDAIMAEFSDVGFDDLIDDMMNDDKIDNIMDEIESAWDFLENLASSTDEKDIAMLDMISALENENKIIEHNLNDKDTLMQYLEKILSEHAGTWNPQVFKPANKLGFDQQLLRQSQNPWEIASAMAITGHERLDAHLEDILENALPIALGYTMKYLKELAKPPDEDWIDKAFDRSETLTEFFEMMTGSEEYRDPPEKIIEYTGKHDIAKGLDLADQINDRFDKDLSEKIFDQWKQSHPDPNLDELLEAVYDDGNSTWESKLENAVSNEIAGKNYMEIADISKQLSRFKHNRITTDMKKKLNTISKKTGTKSMQKIDDKDSFIPQLEDLLGNGIEPDIKKTIEAGKKFNIDELEITELFKNAIELLKSYISSNFTDIGRYDRIVRKISSVSQNIMDEMMKQAVENNNPIAMAALAAADLGSALNSAATMTMPDGSSAQDTLTDSIDKGIGGGENLLKQWFMHRNKLAKKIKEKLKNLMRDALLEIGMEWANKGSGSTEEGIIPILQTRPFRDGDELDQLDIQATLDAILASGRQIDQITKDELMVSDTSKGKTSLGVLIDISGSMSGSKLAMCAIAVVMLIGKLDSKEVAIALFESNTHKIKGFLEEIELDTVADQLLDLKAMGGTRVDMALKWISEEFISVSDSDMKILYLLSDFMFFEDKKTIAQASEAMISEGVKILAAYHGYLDRNRMEHMINMMEGVEMKISDFRNLPISLVDAINNLSS